MFQFPDLDPPPSTENFPHDKDGHICPKNIFYKTMANGETLARDWLYWSRIKKPFYCVPYRLIGKLRKSKLTQVEGWSPEKGLYRKCSEKVCSHENSPLHRYNYVEWEKCKEKIYLRFLNRK